MELYDWQREAIDELVQGNGRVLVVAPTGGGKSMCFQQPAVELEGVALVVTPLVALMADQVASLRARNISATYLASNLDPLDVRRRTELALAGGVKLLYIAPERLASERFVEDVLGRLPISLIAIDEAHCISHWGHDFRPDYLQLGALVERLQPQRLIACTATATPTVRHEILERLRMPDARQILRGFARDNLELSTEETAGAREKERAMLAALTRGLGRPNSGRGTAIVYTGTRAHAETAAQALRAHGWRSEHYHAGMTGDERTRVQERFQAGALDVVTATNAFGMGIDRSDIRVVVHHAIPESVEAYYQEVGRAGRDGAPASGVLLVADSDIQRRFRLIASDGAPTPEQALHRRDLLRAMIAYTETSDCRHDRVLEYFEDTAEELGGCGHCDNCIAAAAGRLGAEPDEEASADVVRRALSAIRGLPFAAGATAVIAYLIGYESKQVRDYDWHTRGDFGALRDRTDVWVRRLLRRCIAAGLLAVGTDRATLHVTRRAVDVISGAKTNPVRLPPSMPATATKSGVVGPAAGLDAEGAALFAHLKAWRREVAQEAGVPAYMVFSDATLRAVVDASPHAIDDLGAISGIGPAKIKQLGPQLMGALASARNGASAREPVIIPTELASLGVLDDAQKVQFSAYQLEVRRTHARAYERWTDEEDTLVRGYAAAGDEPDQIAEKLARQPGAIRMRMEKLGLLTPAQAAAD